MSRDAPVVDRAAYRVPVRILVVTQMWPSPERPELGAFVERQVRALERLGAEVDVASIAPGPGGFRAPLKWARLFAAAKDAARTTSPDVIVGHFMFPGGEAARRAARTAKVPYAVVAHGQDVVNAELAPLLRRRTQRVLDEAGLLVAVSQPLADRLAAVCAVPADVLVAHMGVDRAAFRPGDRDVATCALGPEPSRPLVVQVGVKNGPVLVQAVSAIGGELWLAGPGAVVEGARMLGLVPPADVPRVLRAADVAAFVPEREGYGLGALEAMACGLPVVVSRSIPVAADLPASCTVLVDPGDPVEIGAALQTALGMARDDPAGQTAADRQSADAMAARLLQALDRLR
jgi:glycosyltransferase involved in cell wall biosynthesis